MSVLGTRSAIVGVFVMAALHAAHGQRLPTKIGELEHTVWTIANAAPSYVSSLAQSEDGVLWIANNEGLYRFDGLRFERFELPASQSFLSPVINEIRALPDTSLWIGYFGGGVRVLARGRVVDYTERDGVPEGTIRGFARDSAGDTWVASATGLARLHNGHWQRMGREQRFPGGGASSPHVDRRGGLWVPTPVGMFVLPRGANQFALQSASVDPKQGGTRWPTEAPDGSVWGSSLTLGLTRLSDSAGRPTSPQSAIPDIARAIAILVDRHADAWVITIGKGLVRVRLPTNGDARTTSGSVTRPAAIERVPLMTGANGNAMLEDREGNMWVGTVGGIERFRKMALTPVPLRAGIRWPTIAPAGDGSVWLASDSQHVSLIADEILPDVGAPNNITCAYRDLEGGVWLGGPHGLWHASAGASPQHTRFTRVPLPVASNAVDILAIAQTLAGDVWVSLRDGIKRAVFRRRGGAWSLAPLPPRLSGQVPTTIVADSAGRVWLGYSSRVVLAFGDSTRVYSDSDRIHVGKVSALRTSGHRLWIGGRDGLAVIEGERILRITATEPIRSVTGIVETPNGDLWLNGADGVTHILAAEVSRALKDPSYRAHFERFDGHDGLNGQPVVDRPLPTAIQGVDGRLWFTTSTGVAWIDPDNITRNQLPPPVQVRAITAAGKTYNAGGRVFLPARTTQLQVAYTAFSLATPDRTRFRYRLTNVDTAWVNAGTRREAFYTNVRPGSYRFRVMAANEDGVWNDAGASSEFEIPPSFTQTKAFIGLIAGLIATALIGAGWLLALWRQQQMARALRAQFESQLAERARVARELHDTLLGDMTGVALQLSAAGRAAATYEHAGMSGLFSSLSAQVQQTIIEARRSVSAIRTTPDELLPLHQQLDNVVRRTFGETDITARVERTGSPRTYAPKVESEIIGIATEAMANARRHAECQTVTITCTYAHREVSVRVRDDGRGFELSRAAPDGHWGLVGMRERAASIGATLSVTSAPRMGTDVLLVAPAEPAKKRGRTRQVHAERA